MTEYRNKIRDLLKHYNIGALRYADDQSHGYANKNFKIVTSSGNYFTRFCLQQAVENVEQEIILMKVLEENSFKTAYPVRRNDGDFISYVDKVPVIIYDFLDGQLPGINDLTVSEIAREVALLSTFEVVPGLNKKNAISVEDSIEIMGWDAFRDFKHRDVTENFQRLFEVLKPVLDYKLPTGIVHGDVFPDNTLFKDKRLIGLVDFEEFAIDTLLFDVGMSVNGFCFKDTIMDAGHIEIFISEYCTVRPLSKPEKELIVDYMAWGAVGMTSWHLHQLLFKKNSRQLERVRVLLKRADIILSNRLLIENLIKQ